MSRPSRAKKGSVIGWSIGLAVILILGTNLVIMSGTKSSARFSEISAALREEPIEEPTVEDGELSTTKSVTTGLQNVVDSEREAAGTTNERPQDASDN